MFKNLLLEEAEENWSSGGHEEGDIQVSISDFDSPKVHIQQSNVKAKCETLLKKLYLKIKYINNDLH